MKNLKKPLLKQKTCISGFMALTSTRYLTKTTPTTTPEKTMPVEYPSVVITGKQKAAEGETVLQEWLRSLSREDKNILDPYMALLRAIAKDAHAQQ
jgi:hypothetical protein